MMAEAGFRSPVVSLHADHVRSIRPTLLLLQAGVFFLLLIGAVNLVNLLLIRASGRAKEMAIRRSMGAGRRHVVAQVMMETVSFTVARRRAGSDRGRVGNSSPGNSRGEPFTARRAGSSSMARSRRVASIGAVCSRNRHRRCRSRGST